MLYQYKLADESQPLIPHLGYLQDKYRVDSFVAGCSELHIATKHLLRQQQQKYEFIDPLMEIACNLDAYAEYGLGETTHPAVMRAARAHHCYPITLHILYGKPTHELPPSAI